VAELLVTFNEPTRAPNGDLYYARALGGNAPDGLWQGWLEFVLAGDELALTTGPETEQADRDDLKYWAQGLSAVYLEGALVRALNPDPARAERVSRRFSSSVTGAPPPRPSPAVPDADGRSGL
jgi:hypothetical protein